MRETSSGSDPALILTKYYRIPTYTKSISYRTVYANRTELWPDVAPVLEPTAAAAQYISANATDISAENDPHFSRGILNTHLIAIV